VDGLEEGPAPAGRPRQLRLRQDEGKKGEDILEVPKEPVKVVSKVITTIFAKIFDLFDDF
jgi:hypothetical protein